MRRRPFPDHEHDRKGPSERTAAMGRLLIGEHLETETEIQAMKI